MTRPVAVPICIQFKVFVRGDDGAWRVASSHVNPRDADEAANRLIVRDGCIARVMM
ncbi:hypothetical protein DFR50_110103 [Roseiarcus fermentans]|uniref:Uncharacterized protein n=1 Tax=Roseiarcus fermentans TaxID=1473586 RepID=A0A366FK42_9HYPH|nr:hypothetical protein [Roseiarcus fermentans]RBP14079.1 hypothetical protein DFR50_110103 [Roseiarcus fermentans]